MNVHMYMHTYVTEHTKLIMWVQITPSYILMNIFSSKKSIYILKV